jgi:signal peptidase II
MKERSPLSSFKFQKGLSLPVIITIVVFIVTVWARKIIVDTIELYETLPVIKGFFSIVHVRNPGAAFGLFSKLDSSYRLPVLLGVSIIAILLIEYLLIRSREDQWMERLGLALLGGGTIANFL